MLASRLLVDLDRGRADRERRRPPRAPRAPGRHASARSAPTGSSGWRSRPASSGRSSSASASRSPTTGQVTVPTWRARDVHARDRPRRGGRARRARPGVPRTMPLRRAVAGHLTQEQRLRRVVEDVLVGAGYCEAYTWSLVADDPDPRALRLPDPMSGDQAVLRTTLLARARRGGADERRRGQRAGSRCSSSRASTCPSGEQLPDERWRVGGIAEGGFAAARVRRRGAATRRSTSSCASSAPSTRALHPGQGRRHRRGLARRAPPGAARRGVGRLRARPRHAVRPRARADPLRGRDHVSRRTGRTSPSRSTRHVEAGALVDTIRGGGRRGAARGARVRRLPRRAGRGRAASRSRSTSSSRRPTGR